MKKLEDEEIQQFVEDSFTKELSGKDELLYQAVYKNLAQEDIELKIKVDLAYEVSLKIGLLESRKDYIKYTILFTGVILAGCFAFLSGLSLINASLLFSIWQLFKTHSGVVLFVMISLMFIELCDKIIIKRKLITL